MRYLGFAILILIFGGCAQTEPLTGGPKDIYAPVIDTAKSFPANGQLNFKGNEVSLKFNEFITLNNPNDNILIIPQPVERPTITSKNKRMSILFNEPLEENTTYTITFNGAIQDFTEKNDSVFQYVFSTGNYIDSLEVEGRVIDGFTNKPIGGMLVGLYPKSLEANFDSIPYKFKPMYLGQTSNTGLFKLNYLKAGVYYMFAINDKNKNLLLDPDETMAFIEEEHFILGPDSIGRFEMKAFEHAVSGVQMNDLNFDFPGRVEVLLSNPTDSISVTSNIELLQEETSTKDSLVFWLAENPSSKTHFYVELNGEKDTVKPVYANIPDDVSKVEIKVNNNVKKGKLLPQTNLIFTFSEPVASINDTMVKVFDADSNLLELPDYEIKVRDIEFSTFGTKAHQIIIDSAAVQTRYGRENNKAISLLFDNEEDDYYGSLILNVDTVFTEKVIVHLLNDKGEAVDTADFANRIVFEKVLPGTYQLRLIFDVDGNGAWTTGSLKEKRLPEKVIYNTEQIAVKSKWEKEVDWLFNKKEEEVAQ
ncbi:Ig-like domain-containing protein [Paracrocinitomix mangrovi]|uniref:Ig-like domain-containing protein n=1 Tax=Paracrocinitomix mangrovi TaxID=2862509 RepID=UPI001C8D6781|nr:Ig-like domain-containing protein [Paracrocinitomix mangrovi]UKN00375.1 Ig-like domain-containing protein [Paracrocinitomix mangrovi]